jgi:hypothetical protein
VQIVDAGRHPDDEVAVERDDQVVPRVAEELVTPLWVDGVVEHVGRDVVEHVGFVRPEDADCNGHRVIPSESEGRVEESRSPR